MRTSVAYAPCYEEGSIWQPLSEKEEKRGVSYLITVHCGYDLHYRKIRHYKTWRVPEGWSEKRAEREAQKIAVEFEQKIQQGFLIDNKQTFAEYADLCD